MGIFSLMQSVDGQRRQLPKQATLLPDMVRCVLELFDGVMCIFRRDWPAGYEPKINTNVTPGRRHHRLSFRCGNVNEASIVTWLKVARHNVNRGLTGREPHGQREKLDG